MTIPQGQGAGIRHGHHSRSASAPRATTPPSPHLGRSPDGEGELLLAAPFPGGADPSRTPPHTELCAGWSRTRPPRNRAPFTLRSPGPGGASIWSAAPNRVTRGPATSRVRFAPAPDLGRGSRRGLRRDRRCRLRALADTASATFIAPLRADRFRHAAPGTARRPRPCGKHSRSCPRRGGRAGRRRHRHPLVHRCLGSSPGMAWLPGPVPGSRAWWGHRNWLGQRGSTPALRKPEVGGRRRRHRRPGQRHGVLDSGSTRERQRTRTLLRQQRRSRPAPGGPLLHRRRLPLDRRLQDPAPAVRRRIHPPRRAAATAPSSNATRPSSPPTPGRCGWRFASSSRTPSSNFWRGRKNIQSSCIRFSNAP